MKGCCGGAGWGCLPLAALIRVVLGQRRVGVAVQPLFSTVTTTTTTIIIIIIIITIMTSIMMITLQLSSL